MTDSEIRIDPKEQANPNEVVAEYTEDGNQFPIFFKCDELPLTSRAEAWLGFSLLPAMTTGKTLRVGGTVSHKLLDAMETVQDIYACWYPDTQRVKITAEKTIQRTSPVEGRVGCFFSCGVDSWYTFLKHKDEITDLIFVHGLDIRLRETTLFEQARAMVQLAANRYGKRMVVVKTNLRSFTERSVPYLQIFGPALAGVGHVLSDHFQKIYISGSETYAYFHPGGSSPLLDPLWSSEGFNFVPDGWGANRFKKVEYIVNSDVALQTLRVCWKNTGGEYNCGKCEKCLRTMIQLQAAGALERCKTFNESIDLKRVRRIPVRSTEARYFIENNIRELEARPQFSKVTRALRQAIRRSRWEMPLAFWWGGQKNRWRENHTRFFNLTKRIYRMIKSPSPQSGTERGYWRKNTEDQEGEQ